MKKLGSWFGKHIVLKHMCILLIVILVAWMLGQLAGPALMKKIFL